MRDYSVFRSQDARMGQGPPVRGTQERGVGPVSDDFASRGFGGVGSVWFLDVDGGPVGGQYTNRCDRCRWVGHVTEQRDTAGSLDGSTGDSGSAESGPHSFGVTAGSVFVPGASGEGDRAVAVGEPGGARFGGADSESGNRDQGASGKAELAASELAGRQEHAGEHTEHRARVRDAGGIQCRTLPFPKQSPVSNVCFLIPSLS